MMRRKIQVFLLFGLILASRFDGRRAEAGSLVNGDFSNGLAGWTATADTVSVVNGQAVILESANFNEVDLYQTFTLPVNATVLSFNLVDVALVDDNPPAAFGVSLLDPNTFLSLVPTVDGLTDSFYIRDLDTATTTGHAAPGVTLLPGPSSLPLQINLDVTGLGGQDVQILFRVITSSSTTGSGVTIDDVQVNGTNAVPEPTSILLVACGGALVLLTRKPRSAAVRPT